MGVKIEVRNGNVEKAMRVLKKKLLKDRIMREMKARQYYEKPSEKRVRKQKEMRINYLKKQKLRNRFLGIE